MKKILEAIQFGLLFFIKIIHFVGARLPFLVLILSNIKILEIMKKQNLNELRLNKKSISNLSYEALGGRTYETILSWDGMLSTMGPCIGGTSCCNNTHTEHPMPLG